MMTHQYNSATFCPTFVSLCKSTHDWKQLYRETQTGDHKYTWLILRFGEWDDHLMVTAIMYNQMLQDEKRKLYCIIYIVTNDFNCRDLFIFFCRFLVYRKLLIQVSFSYYPFSLPFWKPNRTKEFQVGYANYMAK